MSHLDNEQHISQDLLLRYVEDACSRLEMRAIDRHLATCPACSDAVEGLMLLSEPSAAAADLNKKIDAKVAEKIAEKGNEKLDEKPVKLPVKSLIEEPVLTVVKRPFWEQRWAAAAAILLLFGSSFWVYKNAQNIDKQVVVNFENKNISDSTAAMTPQYAATSTAKKGEISADVNATKGAVKSGESTLKTDAEIVTSNDNLSKKTDAVSTAQTPETTAKPTAETTAAELKMEAEKGTPAPASAPVVYASPTDRTRDYAGASAQNIVIYPTTAAPAKSKDVAAKAEDKDDFEINKSDKNLQEVVVGAPKAAQKYKETKAPTARSEKVTPSVSTTYDQILSRADDNFKQKKYAAAVVDYAQFLNTETSGDRHERALFQLASCYVKLNKKAEAKVIFEKLSVTDGQYERAAKKALKDL